MDSPDDPVIQAQLSEFADKCRAATSSSACMVICVQKENGETRSFKGVSGGKDYRNSEDLVAEMVLDMIHFIRHVTEKSGLKLMFVHPSGRQHEILNTEGEGRSILSNAIKL